MDFYYIERNSKNKLELVKANEDEIIHNFQEETTTPLGIGGKYFYDEEDSKIRMWTPLGNSLVVFGGVEFTPEEAKEQLLELAIDNFNSSRSNGNFADVWSDIRDDPQCLIKEINDFIKNDLDENDPDYLKTREELQEIVKQLININETVMKATYKKD